MKKTAFQARQILESKTAIRTFAGVRCFRTILALFLAVLTVGISRGLMLPADAEAEIDAGVAEVNLPGFAILIVDADGVIWSKTYGEDVTLETPFLLGSLSKSFTALAIMQLAEAGKLDLDAPMSRYLENDSSPELTIRSLLNQTGGIGTYQTITDYAPEEASGDHIYSNVNYALLGRVIEAVSGLSYEDYLQQNILGPLGMTHTSSDPERSIENGLVQGYENWFGIPVAARAHFPNENDWIQPAAGYISASAADMGRYLQMYLRGGEELLSEAGIEQMFYDGVQVNDDFPYVYAMGWTFMKEPLSEPVLRHSGLVETGMTCMYILPAQGIGIILLANMNDYLIGTDLMDRIGWNLVMRFTGDEPGQIERGEYWRGHFLFNALYAALAAIGIVPFFFLKRFRTRLPARKLHWIITGIVVLYFAIPCLLLAVPRLFLSTPLWVVAAFVPDLYTVLWLCAALLFAGGILRLIILARRRRTIQTS